MDRPRDPLEPNDYGRDDRTYDRGNPRQSEYDRGGYRGSGPAIDREGPSGSDRGFDRRRGGYYEGDFGRGRR